MTRVHLTLADRLRDQITRDGPITVEAYMQACLADPEHGHYLTRNPLGGAGNFITAPEISQIFGELLGAWVANVWQNMGSPTAFNLIELGPGRGTLMSDALRALVQTASKCLDAAEIHLIETSSPLRSEQKKACQHQTRAIDWHDKLNDVQMAQQY